jgi:phospholipase C
VQDDGDKGLSRREVLELAAASAAIAACGDNLAPAVTDGGVDDTPDAAGHADAAGAADAAAPPPDAPIVADASPTDATPLTPDELLAAIDTIVVVCMENRSFDHVLGSMKMIEGRGALDGLAPSMSNLDANGLTVFVHELGDFTPADPPHDWDPVHAQWNNGAMDGFVKAHAGASAADVMGYYVRAQLPVTYAMADAFTVCDRWFCSVLGPTWPNRFYLHGATSNGIKSNVPALGFTSIFNRLDDQNVSNKNYFSDVAWALGGYGKLGGLANLNTFLADAAAGTLPAFSIVDPAFFGAGANDDHPDHDVRLGQAFLATVYAAVAQGPKWGSTLFVVTYDEHGGFFDHVPPPVAVDERAEFAHLGVRVPGLVAGGVVRRGAVNSTTFEHVSVASTATRRFGLEPLNARAMAAADLSSCIDPALVGNPQPGPALPMPPPVSKKHLRELDARLRAAGPPRHHREMWDAYERARLPPALDRRAHSLEDTLAWLAVGERLGAVRVID